MFNKIEAENHKFHQHKSHISIYDVNIDRLVVSNTVYSDKNGFKYFAENKDNSKQNSALANNASKNECI